MYRYLFTKKLDYLSLTYFAVVGFGQVQVPGAEDRTSPGTAGGTPTGSSDRV